MGRGKGSGAGGTSGSGSSTGPGCTAGRISASAVHRRQTRGPGHSLGRAPVTEELVTRWPVGSVWSDDPTSQDNKGRRRPACQHRAPAGTELCQSLNKQALMWLVDRARPWPHPPSPLPQGSGPGLSLRVLQKRQDGAPTPSRGSQRSTGCSGKSAGGGRGEELTVRCQEQWVLGE